MTALTDAEMRAIAEGARPKGNWRFVPWHIEEGAPAVRAPEGWLICNASSDDCARHIAAFDPPTVIALLDRLAKAEAENVRLREVLARVAVADFLDMSLAPERSACAMARAALAAPDVGEV